MRRWLATIAFIVALAGHSPAYAAANPWVLGTVSATGINAGMGFGGYSEIALPFGNVPGYIWSGTNATSVSQPPQFAFDSSTAYASLNATDSACLIVWDAALTNVRVTSYTSMWGIGASAYSTNYLPVTGLGAAGTEVVTQPLQRFIGGGNGPFVMVPRCEYRLYCIIRRRPDGSLNRFMAEGWAGSTTVSRSETTSTTATSLSAGQFRAPFTIQNAATTYPNYDANRILTWDGSARIGAAYTSDSAALTALDEWIAKADTSWVVGGTSTTDPTDDTQGGTWGFDLDGLKSQIASATSAVSDWLWPFDAIRGW